MRRFGSPALFLVAGICFFLPFVTISCNAQAFDQLAQQFEGGLPGELTQAQAETAKLTGFQLVMGDTGETAEAPVTSATGFESGKVSDSRPFAIAALAVAVLGLALSWMRVWIGPILGAVFGIGGVVALFLLKGKVEGIVGTLPPEAAFLGGLGDLIEFKWQPGFWAAMGAFGLAAAWSLFRLVTERRAAAPAQPGVVAPPYEGTTPPPPAPPPPPPPPGSGPPTTPQPGAPPPPTTEPG